MSVARLYHFKKYVLVFLAGLLLLSQLTFAQKDEYRKQFKVQENVMYILLSKKLPLPSLDSFIQSYNLPDIGLYTLILTGRTDSLDKSGWKLETNLELFPYYTISKKLSYGTDLKKSADRKVFYSIPTPDNWRIVGGNRIVYGANKFKSNQVFKQENDVTYFFLKGHNNAKSVKLAGSFSNWQHGAFPLTKTADGWIVPVQLSPGQYFYKFIIDEDNWTTDPENLLSENDGRGNINSVYYVPNKIFFLKGYQTARSVFLTGSFNNWVKDDLQMEKNDGGWQAALYLQPGTHHFHFIVDGKIVKEAEEEQRGQEVKVGKAFPFILKGFTNARKVVLAGNFNDWNPGEIFMERTGDGWKVSYVLGPGNYQYKFIVDGKWMIDPANPNIVDDGEGNLNSFTVIEPNYTFRFKGHANAKKVNIAGEFNNWSPQGLAMTKVGNEWVSSVYLGRGKHLYKFIVDGKWLRDPDNPLWEDEDDNSLVWVE